MVIVAPAPAPAIQQRRIVNTIRLHIGPEDVFIQHGESGGQVGFNL